MLLLFALPILASGFYVLLYHPIAFLKLHRYQGQLLYLKSLANGLLCFFIACIICGALNQLSSNLSIDVIGFVTKIVSEFSLGDNKLSNQIAWIIVISIATMLVAQFWCLLTNAWLSFISQKLAVDAKLLQKRKVVKDSPLDQILFEASVSGRVLLISLSNRKVYAGLINSMGEPTENRGMDQEIQVVVLLSGYRDEKDLTVNFTFDYRHIDDEQNEQPNGMVIRQELIESVVPLDFDVYAQYREKIVKDKVKAQ